MMSSEAGYTTALMKTALQLGKVQDVAEDLPVVLELVSSNAGYFKSPEISSREKAGVFSQMLDGQIDELTIVFAALLAQRGRLRYLPGVAKRFKKFADEELGRCSIRITLPYEPSGDIMEKLEQHLIEIGMCRPPSEGKTAFDVVVDKGIIGGFIAESESKLVDMSIRTRLRRLRLTNMH